MYVLCAISGSTRFDPQQRTMADQRKSEDPFLGSLQKLDDELTCPVCSDHFTEPKVLPCLHFYCKTCIADLIKRAKGRPFTCPECRRETNAEGDNPDNLPTAFFVNRMEELFSVMKKAERKDSVTCESCSQFVAVDFCHDCSEYICTHCVKAHKQMRLLSSHRVVSIDSLRSTIGKNPTEKLQVFSREVKCSKHKDEPLKLYCHDCSKLVCRDCIVIDHKDHKYAFVIDTAPLCKAEIQEKVESVKKITEGVKSAIKLLGESKKKLSDRGAATTVAIDKAIDEIVTKLTEKRREMKEKASRIVSEAEDKIAAQEKNAQLAVGELESLQEFMSRQGTATDQEVLSLKKQVSDQVERVSELYRDADKRFPVPELPELVVNCRTKVKQAIESKISVTLREPSVQQPTGSNLIGHVTPLEALKCADNTRASNVLAPRKRHFPAKRAVSVSLGRGRAVSAPPGRRQVSASMGAKQPPANTQQVSASIMEDTSPENMPQVYQAPSQPCGWAPAYNRLVQPGFHMVAPPAVDMLPLLPAHMQGLLPTHSGSIGSSYAQPSTHSGSIGSSYAPPPTHSGSIGSSYAPPPSNYGGSISGSYGKPSNYGGSHQ